MIDVIVDAALEPFKHEIGWQAFAYGVTGKVVILYAKNFISQYSDSAAEAADETQEDVEEGTNGESE